MSVLINQKNCITSRKNLGIPDCIVEVGIPKGYIKVPVGWSIDLSSDTLDKDYVNSKVQTGEFIPVLGAVQFTQNTPEATIEEAQGGVKAVVRNGLPEFVFKFWKGGWKFANALYSYNSQQAFDILLVFSNGAIAGATNGTDFTGFELGMLNSGTYMFTDGSVNGSVSVTMQLINEAQYNSDVAILSPDVLDFKTLTDLNPITDIVLTARADASDNKVYFKAKFAMNTASNLGGIAIANLKSFVEGTADTITALSLSYNSTTEEWSYTPTATLGAGDEVVVQLYDSVNTVACAKIGNKYYKGTSNTAVTVA